MRKVKFRAWDKDSLKWSDTPMTYAIKDINYYTDYVWCQYTGINDITGKEIYEGDIVTSESTHPGMGYYCKGVVKFYEGTYYIESKGTGNIIPLFDETNELNIVGNIYENPIRLY